MEATETPWSPRENNLPHTVHLSGDELQNCPRGQMPESFEVKTGVRQGCLLPPFLFLLVVDWIMKTSGRNNGIQWTLWTQLDYLDFADDLALLSHNHSQMQTKTSLLETTLAGSGLKINREKTELMKMNTTANAPVTVLGEPKWSLSSTWEA